MLREFDANCVHSVNIYQLPVLVRHLSSCLVSLSALCSSFHVSKTFSAGMLLGSRKGVL